MDFDVAVLGGGPAGYTAAIRAAQLGARVACIEREAELGGTCLRVGCVPTKAWVSTAHALHAAREIDPKLWLTRSRPSRLSADRNCVGLATPRVAANASAISSGLKYVNARW